MDSGIKKTRQKKKPSKLRTPIIKIEDTSADEREHDAFTTEDVSARAERESQRLVDYCTAMFLLEHLDTRIRMHDGGEGNLAVSNWYKESGAPEWMSGMSPKKLRILQKTQSDLVESLGAKLETRYTLEEARSFLGIAGETNTMSREGSGGVTAESFGGAGPGPATASNRGTGGSGTGYMEEGGTRFVDPAEISARDQRWD